MSVSEHIGETDSGAYDHIREKQSTILGAEQPFTIERPSDLLRIRLLTGQDLSQEGQASLGKPAPAEHWPFPREETTSPPSPIKGPLPLSLAQALHAGAANSFSYQDFKEDVFRAALKLDLTENEFRNTFTGILTSLFSTEKPGRESITGMENSGEAGLTRKFGNGVALSTLLAVDLATLLGSKSASALGITADSSISIPLLRGAGRHIVQEPLTLAHRAVVYRIYDFERFKRIFAVDVAQSYLSVLQEKDRVRNTRGNYMRLTESVKRARRLADAGRLPEIQVDQAVQDELRARDSWISAKERHDLVLDEFKVLLGLPADSDIRLDRKELDLIAERSARLLGEKTARAYMEKEETAASAPPVSRRTPDGQGGKDTDAPSPPGRHNPGPYELPVKDAVAVALGNRLDLRVLRGKIYDAQRAVVTAADAMGAELTLLGRAVIGEGRSIRDAERENGELDFGRGRYSALFTLDLPLERTRERVALRERMLDLDKAVRAHNRLEDRIKIDVRSRLRELLSEREGMRIQAKGVAVAKKRIGSTTLFLKAGRAAIRDLLEAEDALLNVQNALTAAVVGYRVAEMALMRDMGVLAVDEKGVFSITPPENRVPNIR